MCCGGGSGFEGPGFETREAYESLEREPKRCLVSFWVSEEELEQLELRCVGDQTVRAVAYDMMRIGLERTG